jgi:hypothetical protein
VRVKMKASEQTRALAPLDGYDAPILLRTIPCDLKLPPKRKDEIYLAPF